MPVGIMSLAPSERLGPYEILDLVGSGGMGVVYRAHDPRLGRQVAIKVLLPEIASDEESLTRFEREARAVAAISHANILGIYDFQREGATAYAVMEFLEGGTLRNALASGALPVRQAVRIAVQIASGLAAAHDRNFIHRDLKPENVGLTGDGQAKVLDFGLARLSSSTELTNANLTTPGLILGTVNYMSPEQVRGEDLDHRSDLFSFGIVLHEMLTNRKPFERRSAAETMTAILKEEPLEVTGSGTNLPPAVDRVIRRCLEKNPSDRFHSARDLAFALENAMTPGRSEEVVRPPARRSPLLVPALCVVAGVGGGLLLSPLLRSHPVVEPVSIRQLTMSGVDSEPSASTDGRFLAYTSSQGGVSRLWVRAIDTGGELPLTTGHRPRFFPDQSVLYLREEAAGEAGSGGDSAWSIPMLGGKPPHLILRGVVEVDPSPDGHMVAFVRSSDAGDVRTATLGVAPADGGDERVLVTATDVELSCARWSPDGRQLAVIQRAAAGSSATVIKIVDAATGKARDLPAAGTGTYGTLAWNGDGQSLIVTNTDNAQVFVPGTPGRVVRVDVATGRRETLFYAPNLFGLFGTSDANAGIDILGPGAVVFDPVEIRQNLGVVHLDRAITGAADRLETSGNGLDRQPAFSPDGRFVIFTSNRSGNLDLWLLVTATGELRQLTNDPAQDWDPGFAPDGKHVLWSSNRLNRHLEIWIADFDSTSLTVSGDRQVSHDGEDAENPTMAAGTNVIVYGSGNAAKPGIWRVKSDGTAPVRLASGPYSIPDVSPDGRYALFLEDDRVHLHRTIRVLDVAAPEHKTDFTIAVPYQVIEGSADITWGRARWMPDGKSILFVAQDGNGRSGLYTQAFVPGQDTSATRKLVAGALAGATIESFGVANAADRIAVSNGYYSRSLKVAEGIPGVTVAAKSRR